MSPHLFINVTHLCGNQSLSPWLDDKADFGRCFQIVAMLAPAHFLLALASAYAMGVKMADEVPRTWFQLVAVNVRVFSAVCLGLTTLSTFVAFNALPKLEEEGEADFGLSEYLEAGSICLAWLFNSVYLSARFGCHSL